MGGFSKTPEGKATVAAFMDAFNNMVISLRSYRAQDVKGGLGRGGALKVDVGGAAGGVGGAAGGAPKNHRKPTAP